MGPEHPLATRSSGGGPILGDGEGRFARGWRLLGKSWGFLRERPKLLVVPALSAVATTIAALLIFVPVFEATSGLSYKVSFFIATASAAFPFVLASTFFNVAFLDMAQDHMAGREPSVRSGLRYARALLRPILAWSILATVVGAIINALQSLPFDGSDLFGRILGWIGGLAWGLATFFVVPVLAIHGTGARESVRRSARVFRERWGETLTGDITIALIFSVLIVPACMCGVLGAMAFDAGDTAAGVVLVAIAVVLSVPLLAVQSALTELFTLVLYREATEKVVVGPFSEYDLRSAWQQKEKSWWHRWRHQ